MPASALKKLKASLQEQRNGKAGKPQAKQPPRPKKETTAQRADRIRRDTLLPEWQRRSKVGGIVDRRIGENDPAMAPEDRMLKRFVAENSRSKRANAFNLDDESDLEDGVQLTHGGRPLDNLKQIGPADDQSRSNSDAEDDGLFSRSKRPLEEAIEDATRRQEQAEEDGEPARKKSKKEVMEEVIAKSKLHKHERQQAHEEDLDMRDELDKDLPDLLALLGGGKNKRQPANGSAHPTDAAKEYDQRVRQMAQDKRAQPSERTKTDEEKAEEHAKHLQDLENQRLRRMRGEVAQEDESDAEDDDEEEEEEEEAAMKIDADENGADDAATFGFASSKVLEPNQTSPESGLDDEDDFLIEKDLVADASDLESDIDVEQAEDSDFSGAQDEISAATHADADDDDDDFLKDVLDEKVTRPSSDAQKPAEASSLAYTYPCPQTHDELREVFKNVSHDDIPVVIQRIRALYHTSLAAQNKTKLKAFAGALIDHVAYLPIHDRAVPMSTVEAIVRHVHSMSRAFAIEIADAYRLHIERIENIHTASQQPALPNAGDLSILTAIGSTFPTSDHFHQVVTPAITTIAHWLETLMLRAQAGTLTDPESLTGAYMVGLALKYQRLSQRLVPEALRFTARALPATTNSKTLSQHLDNTLALVALYKDSKAALEALLPLQAALKSTQPHASLKQTQRTLKAHLSSIRLARRPLEEHHHRPLAIKTALPQFEDTFNPTKHYETDKERGEAAALRKAHRRETKAAARELRRDAEFVGREKLRARKAADAAYDAKFRRIVGGINAEEGAGRNAYEREREKERRKRRF